jgi:uncharacterized protein (DUF2252 family)
MSINGSPGAAQISQQGRNPLALLAEQESDRLPWLVPVRHSRMAQNPFSFFRGAAAVMAWDLAQELHSGLMVQLCGDAHLLNFGFYGSPERKLLFDINDFDETYPGPFEWDVQRLAASCLLAARSINLSPSQQEKICRRTVRAYAKAMARFAAMPFLELWTTKLDLDRLFEESENTCLKNHLKGVVAQARQRNSRQAVKKLCVSDSQGGLHFRHNPPLIWRHGILQEESIGDMDWETFSNISLTNYLANIRPEMKHLISQFRLADSAYKAVGVGSVGTRCAVNLFVDDHSDEALVLQTKQAMPSVLAAYLNTTEQAHQGERVVTGQRLMQTSSDAFLAWFTNATGYHMYVRQLRDWKGSVDVGCLNAEALSDYGRLCGWTLAKAHARSGDRRAIAARIQNPKDFAKEVLKQALTHAELAENDHTELQKAINDGMIQASDVF